LAFEQITTRHIPLIVLHFDVHIRYFNQLLYVELVIVLCFLLH